MREVGGSNPPPPILKKILILTANYGAGHLIASQGLREIIEDDENKVEILDIVEAGSKIEKLTSKLYVWLNRYSHFLWRIIYYNPIVKTKFFKNFLKLLLNKNIYNRILNFNPDIVISTHFFATIYGIKFKREKNNVKLFVCITDYEIHPIWLFEGVDLFFLPSEFSLKTFKGKNFLVTGIPLRKGFLMDLDEVEIKNFFDIRTDKLVVLLNLGANSVLPIKDAIKFINLFKEKLYFLIIAGKDEKRFEMIRNFLSNIKAEYKLFGFTQEIYKLISVCDFSITKAGGLSVSELIYLQKPAIYYKSLPGQEEGNEKFIKEYGLGLTAKNFSQLVKLTQFIIENPDILDFFKRNLFSQKKKMKFLEIKKIVSHETYAL